MTEDIPSDEAKFFCKTLADAEYDRGQGNGLAVFDQMLCVAEGCPYRCLAQTAS